MTENKLQQPRTPATLIECIDEIKGQDKKQSLTTYETIDLALKLQANYNDFNDGDYRDEHMYFLTNALLSIRDEIRDLNIEFGEDD